MNTDYTLKVGDLVRIVGPLADTFAGMTLKVVNTWNLERGERGLVDLVALDGSVIVDRKGNRWGRELCLYRYKVAPITGVEDTA